jgi:DNA topoisomerase-1
MDEVNKTEVVVKEEIPVDDDIISLASLSDEPVERFIAPPEYIPPEPVVEEQPIEGEISEEVCDKCGKPMVVRQGKYGKFLACSGYPHCKNIKKMEPTKAELENKEYGICPKCGKTLKKIVTNRATFYGCTGYPDCDFTSFDPVLEEKCPKCGSYTVLHSLKSGDLIKCSNKNCDYKRKAKGE